MKVSKLISELQKFDPELDVVVSNCYPSFYPCGISKVEAKDSAVYDYDADNGDTVTVRAAVITWKQDKP